MSATRGRTFLLLCAPAVLGAALLLSATRGGLGLTPDSAAYVAAARSLRAGRGLSAPDLRTASWAPMTHWPPLFSIVLSALGLAGIEALQAARGLHAMLLGGSCVLVGLLVQRQAVGRRWLGLLAALVAANSACFVDVHVMAWTEPLFIFLALLSMLFLHEHFREGKRLPLLAAALAVGLALLTRYVGVVLIATGGSCLLLFRGRKLRTRIADSALFGLVACVGPGLWFLRNRLVAGSVANRGIALHPITAEKARMGLITVSRWLMPQSFPEPLRMILAGGVLVAAPALAIWLGRRAAGPREAGNPPGAAGARVAALLAVFSAWYVAFLVASICLIDDLTPLDNRILSPLNPVLLVLVFLAAGGLASRLARRRALHVAVLVVLVGFSSWKVYRNFTLLPGRREGEGFSTRAWRQSPTMATVRALPEDVPVYSNCPEAIYLLTERLVHVVPYKANPYSRAVNQRFEAELDAMAAEIRDRKGVLLYLPSIPRWYLPSEDELKRRLPHLTVLPIDPEDPKGRLYGIPQVP